MCPSRARTAASLSPDWDYATMQIVTLASVTDGTSNSILLGEVLPIADANINFWGSNGASAGTTVPIGWDSNSFPAASPDCNDGQWEANTNFGCRFSAATKGFRSRHPGGANFLFADGSLHFLKRTISMPT